MKYCASTSTKPSPKPWWKNTIIGVLAHPCNVVPAFQGVLDFERKTLPKKVPWRETF